MNDRIGYKAALMFFALAVDAAAVARDSGKSSHASISISITVPPGAHSQRDLSSELLVNPARSLGACVPTNSRHHTFRVPLAGTGQNRDVWTQNALAEHLVALGARNQRAPTSGSITQYGTTIPVINTTNGEGCRLDVYAWATLTTRPEQRTVQGLDHPSFLTLLITPD